MKEGQEKNMKEDNGDIQRNQRRDIKKKKENAENAVEKIRKRRLKIRKKKT